MSRLLSLLLIIALSAFSLEAKDVPIILPQTPPEILDIVSPFLGDRPIIFEAGSYNGDDTLLLSSRWPNGRVFTFEPHPALFPICYARLKNKKNVHIEGKALSNQCGMVPLYLSEIGGHPSASSSLLPPELHKVIYDFVQFPGVVHVETTTLDQFSSEHHLQTIDFIWLDTQGNELPILKAYSKIKEVKAIYSEVSFVDVYKDQPLFGELTDYLETQGFDLFGVDFGWKIQDEKVVPSTTAGQGNALFLRSDLH